MALAALAVTSGVAGGAGIVSAMVGAVLGVVAGELLGRSRFRLAAVVLAHASSRRRPRAGLAPVVWQSMRSTSVVSSASSMVAKEHLVC